jgi:putative pyruvate formate lyase activating enzyme
MACAYCQNHEFSQKEAGREVGREELAGFMLELQEQGCHNINLVTPTHVMPQILEALKIAAAGGLHIPLVYNSGGFELPGVLKLLEGIVDIYLPDMRYSREDHAIKYSSAPAYPHYNRMAIKEMHRQVGIARINQDGIIEKGLIVRHLVLPNGLAGTQEAMEFLATEISQDTYVSLMSQYLPRYRSSEFIELSRRLKREEYACAQKTLEEHGLANGWSQEETTPERFAGTNLKPNL